ncbi:MAG: AhpC/TSA family protein [Massilibacteroides sp.]|nr:AhpC/TSA family protein [Massilibacteroides sp.]
MKKVVFMALIAITMMACNQKPSYQISGTVDDESMNGKIVYLYSTSDRERTAVDSTIVKKGAFKLKGEQAEPRLMTLGFSQKELNMKKLKDFYPIQGGFMPYEATFVVDNSKIEVQLKSRSTIAGIVENNDYMALLKQLRQTFSTLPEISEMMHSKTNTEEQKAEIERKYEALDQQASTFVTSYIKAHLNKLTAAKLFLDYRYSLEDKIQNEILAEAGEMFKAYPMMDRQIEHLNKLNKVAIGKKYIDFELNDLKGKPIKLSDYVGKNKVVMVDFWASWCPPCIRSIPGLLEMYKTYHKKGFEIVGVSLDQNQKDWEEKVKELKITWPQMSDLKGWNNAGSQLYAVNSIPHLLLIDKDGTIVARNLHGEELEAKIKELLK